MSDDNVSFNITENVWYSPFNSKREGWCAHYFFTVFLNMNGITSYSLNQTCSFSFWSCHWMKQPIRGKHHYIIWLRSNWGPILACCCRVHLWIKSGAVFLNWMTRLTNIHSTLSLISSSNSNGSMLCSSGVSHLFPSIWERNYLKTRRLEKENRVGSVQWEIFKSEKSHFYYVPTECHEKKEKPAYFKFTVCKSFSHQHPKHISWHMYNGPKHLKVKLKSILMQYISTQTT